MRLLVQSLIVLILVSVCSWLKFEAVDNLSVSTRGKRVLWINSFFLFDYESGLHLHHSAVEGQVFDLFFAYDLVGMHAVL